MDILAENRITIENTAFYQNGSENSGSNIAPDKPYPYVKKARRKLKYMSLRLAFARTGCTPMTHCVPMGWNS